MLLGQSHVSSCAANLESALRPSSEQHGSGWRFHLRIGDPRACEAHLLHRGYPHGSHEYALSGAHYPERVGLAQILPVVIATGRHLQTTAHQSDWVLVAAALDHRVPFDDSLAKYAAASFKKSRSFVTRASSRLRRASSSSRGLPVPGKGFSAARASRTQRFSKLGATPIS